MQFHSIDVLGSLTGCWARESQSGQVCGSVSLAGSVVGFLGVMGAACVGVWVFASSACSFAVLPALLPLSL